MLSFSPSMHVGLRLPIPRLKSKYEARQLPILMGKTLATRAFFRGSKLIFGCFPPCPSVVKFPSPNSCPSSQQQFVINQRRVAINHAAHFLKTAFGVERPRARLRVPRIQPDGIAALLLR